MEHVPEAVGTKRVHEAVDMEQIPGAVAAELASTAVGTAAEQAGQLESTFPVTAAVEARMAVC
jgi:hypothetical protein